MKETITSTIHSSLQSFGSVGFHFRTNCSICFSHIHHKIEIQIEKSILFSKFIQNPKPISRRISIEIDANGKKDSKAIFFNYTIDFEFFFCLNFQRLCCNGIDRKMWVCFQRDLILISRNRFVCIREYHNNPQFIFEFRSLQSKWIQIKMESERERKKKRKTKPIRMDFKLMFHFSVFPTLSSSSRFVDDNCDESMKR